MGSVGLFMLGSLAWLDWGYDVVMMLIQSPAPLILGSAAT
jgi:hypothetical protein